MDAAGELRRKLLVGQKVEVRKVNQGCEGSWSTGIVVAEKNLVRKVKFDHDGNGELVKHVPVTPMIEGVIPAFGSQRNYRGSIRPLPPVDDVKSSLHYGLCVDAYVEGVWWEGVVMDHEDSSEERIVFFPDLGYESMMKTGLLRITQDWDEISELWTWRGDWVFLELIEVHMKEMLVELSVGQIWSRFRGNENFKKKISNWTCSVGSMWEPLILDFIQSTAWNITNDSYAAVDCTDHSTLTSSLDDQRNQVVAAKFVTKADSPSGYANSPDEGECITSQRKRRKINCSTELVHGSPLEVCTPPQMLIREKSPTSNFTRGSDSPFSIGKYSFVDDLDEVDNWFAGDVSQEPVHLNDTTLKDETPTDPNHGASAPVVDSDLLDGNGEMGYNDLLIKEDENKTQVVSLTKSHKRVDCCDKEINIEPHYCPQAVIDWYNVGSGKQVKGKSARDMTLKAKQHLLAVGWRLHYIVKQETRRELRYVSPQGKTHISLVRACKESMENPISGHEAIDPSSRKFTSATKPIGVVESVLSNNRQSEEKNVKDDNDSSHVGKKRKAPPYITIEEDKLDNVTQNFEAKSSKREHGVVVAPPTRPSPRTVLSWLIDKNVVSPRSKVYYRRDGCTMAEGNITVEGIRCNCCQKVFCVSSFQVHAGGTSCQPSGSIYLEDGRTLLQCQKQIIQDNHKLKDFSQEPCQRIKRDSSPTKNCKIICSFCHLGGELLLCDQCPSAYHTECLGLTVEDMEDNWLCPSCRCSICEHSEFNGDVEKFTEKTILYCDQCEQEYHVGCIRQRERVKLETCPKGNWFCSQNCEKIFSGLHEILGRSFSVGVKNLSCTILKSYRNDYNNLDAFETDMVEHNSKLNVALRLMHDSFKPIKDPLTDRDLIESVLFNYWSKANRVNYRGFYTMILEREDEMVSVATFRVHGAKVAEVPFIATCQEYRRQGMCNVLMDVLQKKLGELGVERLLAPAREEIARIWTKSFGFSKITELQRSKFMQYTFMTFVGSTICQKILRTAPEEKTLEPTDHNDANVCQNEDIVAYEIVQDTHESFWIQVHGLHPKLLCVTAGEVIGNSVGKMIEFDHDHLDAHRENLKYIRIRILVDISKRLPTGTNVVIGSKKFWVRFAYEQLPVMCYNCGVVGHKKDDCTRQTVCIKMNGDRLLNYGPWLAAVEPKNMNP